MWSLLKSPVSIDSQLVGVIELHIAKSDLRLVWEWWAKKIYKPIVLILGDKYVLKVGKFHSDFEI